MWLSKGMEGFPCTDLELLMEYYFNVKKKKQGKEVYIICHFLCKKGKEI